MYVKKAPELHNTFFSIGDYEFKNFQGECFTFVGENISVKQTTRLSSEISKRLVAIKWQKLI